jgi:hypothetical protein
VHIAALKQERSVIKTPPGSQQIRNLGDVDWRHTLYLMRNSKKAELGQIDVGPTSQWVCSRRWKDISEEIITAEAVADTHLAPIAASECQQIMDDLAQRLPRELRDDIYKWLVPTESFSIRTNSCLESLPTTSTPRAMPPAKSWDGFSFSMFHYMKGDHNLEILKHWYQRTLFTFQGVSSRILKFLATKPFGTNLIVRDVVRNISIILDIPQLNQKFKARYDVETEVPSLRVNFLQYLHRIDRLAFQSKRKTKVHIRLDKGQTKFWDPISLEDLEELFESLWPYMERMIDRRYMVTMNGTVPDMKTPSPKTWARCYSDVSPSTNYPSQPRCADQTLVSPRGSWVKWASIGAYVQTIFVKVSQII